MVLTLSLHGLQLIVLYGITVSFLTQLVLTEPSPLWNDATDNDGDGGNDKEASGGVRFPKGWRNNLEDIFKSGEEMSYNSPEIPKKFDAREKWPECPSIHALYETISCSIWGVAVAAVLTDRLCIATKGKDKFEYSGQDLVSCCEKCIDRNLKNCSGGNVVTAIKYVQEHGLVSGGDVNSSRGCKPLIENETQCEQKCTNKQYKTGYNQDKRYATGFRKYHNKALLPWDKSAGVDNVFAEIMTKGPVLALADYKMDFLLFCYEIKEGKAKEEIFKEKKYDGIPMAYMHLHVLKLIGWGDDGVKDYWIAVNFDYNVSKGIIKINRGSNTMQMERLAFAPEPLLNHYQHHSQRFLQAMSFGIIVSFVL